ncbi:alcohol dehydrogenase catalytic domain-containing protein [Marininema halotolerans]|uniref:Alcohol dehydrogenase n=1 Tax=Marininema halotolerans TaxID=1155944 RepID=A0A1I6RJR6_9BACL|nr:zinc-binding dehydrogenase [Marininema halotolerans]SFS64942.1 alcohol dehydrogenase [Marininema halotolerans]
MNETTARNEKNMRELLFDQRGGVRMNERPKEALQEGHVAVDVHYFGINFADYQAYFGKYLNAPKGPFVPGYEFSGVVTESRVAGLEVGDEVWGVNSMGCYADHLHVPGEFCFKKPEKMTLAEAGAFPVNYATAYYILDYMGNLQRDHRLLVQSAAGGVGRAMMQMAQKRGAKVTALVGSEEKIATLKQDFPDAEVINYRQSATIDDALGDRTFDLIADPQGGPGSRKLYRRLHPFGKLITFGVSSSFSQGNGLTRAIDLLRSPFFPVLSLLSRNVMVGGMNLTKVFEHPAALQYAVSPLLDGFNNGDYSIEIYKEVPFSEEGIQEAYKAFETREVQGKMIVRVR